MDLALTNAAPLARTRELVAFDETTARFLTRSRSAATSKTYAADLRHFFRWVGVRDPDGIPTLDEARAVTWRHVTAYRDHFYLPDKTGRSLLAADTGARRLSVIGSFFEELRRASVIPTSPAADVPRPRAKNEGTTAGLAPSEVERVFAACPRGTPSGDRDLLLLAMLFYEWLRVSEAVRLRVEDLGSESNLYTLKIRQKGGRDRTIAMHPEVAKLARNYVQRWQVSGFLFPAFSPGATTDKPMSTEAARLVFKRACARAGLDADRFSPHSARVTGITEALLAKVPLDVVQDFAGHARPETTLRYHRARRRLLDAPVAALPYKLPSEEAAASPRDARSISSRV